MHFVQMLREDLTDASVKMNAMMCSSHFWTRKLGAHILLSQSWDIEASKIILNL